MNWKQVMQKRWEAARHGFDGERSEAVTRDLKDSPTSTPSHDVQTELMPTGSGNGLRKAERIRLWRRRVLFRRGAALHVGMSPNARSDASLAMLDEAGVVVSWYGRTDGNDRSSEQVVNRHISQFYVAQDLATEQPLRDLHDAVVEGSSTRQGWRLRNGEAAVWATTVIEAVTLRDGRLQGFSWVTRPSERPSDHLPVAQSLNIEAEETSVTRRALSS